MKILVLGKGQLGQELLGLNSQTTSVVAFNSVECDICDKTTVELTIKKIDPNIVVNTAAYTNVDEAEDNIKEAFSVNAQGPENISKVCEKFRIPLIHISTDYVFDGRKGEAYVESDEVNPLCVYGKSKLQGEQNVQTFCSNFLIIRTSWLYSTYGNNFVKTMLKLGLKLKELSVVNDQVGSPTYAKDLAEKIIIIATEIYNGKTNYAGVYHYANEDSCSWFQFAQEIFTKVKLDISLNPIETEQYPFKAKRPSFSVLNSDKLKKQFNLGQSYPWKLALNRFLVCYNKGLHI